MWEKGLGWASGSLALLLALSGCEASIWVLLSEQHYSSL